MVLLPLLLLLMLVVVANRLTNPAQSQLFHQFLALSNVGLILSGIGLLVIPRFGFNAALAQLSSLPSGPTAGLIVLGSGAWGVGVSQRRVRQWLANGLPIQPLSAVHTLALVLSGYLFGLTGLTLAQGGMAGLAETAVALSVFDVVLQQLYFVLLAFLGVGLFTRRNSEALNARLGLVWPTQPQVATAVRWVFTLIFLQWMVGIVWYLTNPAQAELLGNLSETLFGQFDTVWEWFVLALVSSIGEELLFRGALQPVLGLGFTAVLFAVAHVQYGTTPATLAVLVVGISLGYVRQKHSTTTTILIHFGYNFILGLFSLLALYLEPFVR